MRAGRSLRGRLRMFFPSDLVSKVFPGVFAEIPQEFLEAVERSVQGLVKLRVSEQMSHFSFSGVEPREKIVDLFERIRRAVIRAVAFKQGAGRALAGLQFLERIPDIAH